MTRAWDEWVAGVFDVVPPLLVLVLLLASAALGAAAWYHFPAWVPRRLPGWRLTGFRLRAPRLPRWRLPRFPLPRFRLRWWRQSGPTWRWWRRRRAPAAPTVPAADVPRPAPAPDGLTLADRLAAEGRFAEAIRQRLRDVVGELVAAGVVAPQPGWTATELTTVAAASRPDLAAPLDNATALFSEIWYGQRPARPSHDDYMRQVTGQIRASLYPARRTP